MSLALKCPIYQNNSILYQSQVGVLFIQNKIDNVRRTYVNKPMIVKLLLIPAPKVPSLWYFI